MQRTEQLTRENHYVPQSYLRRWADESGKVWVTRLLVPDERMPLWKSASTRGIAKHQHLYTRMVAGRELDDIERWLNQEFEMPAYAAIDKAVSGCRLSSLDWHNIIRFTAAQDVRTPASLLRMLRFWSSNLQSTVEEVLTDSVRTLETAKKNGVRVESIPHPDSQFFPINVSTEIEADAEYGTIRVDTIVGRGLWLFSLKQRLTHTLNVLLKHKWTILVSPPGMQWITTDDPVVKLNYESEGKYDFGGGWGSIGTEIFMPLSPNHLLYTRVGHRPQQRGTVVPQWLAEAFQKFSVEHAHRVVFAKSPEASLARLRSRHVSAEAYKHEVDQWAVWHELQVAAEQDLLDGR